MRHDGEFVYRSVIQVMQEVVSFTLNLATFGSVWLCLEKIECDFVPELLRLTGRSL